MCAGQQNRPWFSVCLGFFICWISVTFIFLHSETKPFFPQLLHAHSTCSEQDVLSAMNHRAVHHRDCSWHQCLGHMTTSTHQAITSLTLPSCPWPALINLGKVQHHPAWAVGNWRSSWARSSITTFVFSNQWRTTNLSEHCFNLLKLPPSMSAMLLLFALFSFKNMSSCLFLSLHPEYLTFVIYYQKKKPLFAISTHDPAESYHIQSLCPEYCYLRWKSFLPLYEKSCTDPCSCSHLFS